MYLKPLNFLSFLTKRWDGGSNYSTIKEIFRPTYKEKTIIPILYIFFKQNYYDS